LRRHQQYVLYLLAQIPAQQPCNVAAWQLLLLVLLLTGAPRQRAGAVLLLGCVLHVWWDCQAALPDVQLCKEALMCQLITQKLQ
jgi:hypothetical protein